VVGPGPRGHPTRAEFLLDRISLGQRRFQAFQRIVHGASASTAIPPYRRTAVRLRSARAVESRELMSVMGTKMDRFRGFGEASPRSAFYVHSWHYELESWSKCSAHLPGALKRGLGRYA
ncbi:MAG: hypothetical protein IIA55_12875, partial [Gemmatimonadetes bacterium]|nr:hypothetical protein [Gemmatimonadota bacterium]